MDSETFQVFSDPSRPSGPKHQPIWLSRLGMEFRNSFTSLHHYDPVPVTYSSRDCFPYKWRIFRCCILGLLLPIVCITVPLYARFVLYSDNVWTLAASDMRLIDSHVSTAWCQAERLSTNLTFNAYLLHKEPHLRWQSKRVSMTRAFTLSNDVKIYWGFYLLKGSEIGLTTCASKLGANLMLLQGRSSLHYCAYVGDESSEDEDSSEEETELEKVRRKLGIRNTPPPMFGPGLKRKKADTTNRGTNPGSRQTTTKPRTTTITTTTPTTTTVSSAQNNKTANQTESLYSSATHKLENIIRKLFEKEVGGLLEDIEDYLGTATTKAEETEDIAVTMKPSLLVPKLKNAATLESKSQNFSKLLTDDAEDENHGGEEDEEESGWSHLHGDELAVDRGVIDHRKPEEADQSKSEEESSFSSSEEAMLQCKGVLLSLPIVPHHNCGESLLNSSNAARTTLRYTVEEEGYYYFIFSSENEKSPNPMAVTFDLVKTVYDIKDTVSACHNTSVCDFEFHFASDERIVVEVPLNNPYDDQTYVITTHCQPRAAVYLLFCVTLPIIILLFAHR